MKPTDVIERNYLKKFLFMLLLLLLVITSLSSAVLHLSIHEPLNTHYSAILSIVADLKETLLITTLKISAVSSLLAALGLLFLGTLYTHRIAGPLYRIRSLLNAIGEGKFDTKITLRSNDAIHHFAESVNAMIERYRDRFRILEQSLKNLEKNVNELESSPDGGKDIDSLLHDIAHENGKIRSHIDSISL